MRASPDCHWKGRAIAAECVRLEFLNLYGRPVTCRGCGQRAWWICDKDGRGILFSANLVRHPCRQGSEKRQRKARRKARRPSKKELLAMLGMLPEAARVVCYAAWAEEVQRQFYRTHEDSCG
jgi:hypothetical protein